ncbi:MAG: methyltransferase domain-containing protein, partial [Anaerolineales bacterium]|nr:methyltransferase domain-containing protein [Anaerolineales bacterium]
MEKVGGQNFDDGMAAWQAYQDAPWGKLRYRIAQANLEPHLPKTPANILDLGGGNGFDAIPLAQNGFSLSILDFSAEMIAQGQQLAETRGVADNTAFAIGNAEQLADHYAEPAFDVVLCHNVLQYVADVTAVLTSIHNTLKPGGILSLMITNPHTETLSYALREYDMQTALENLDKRTKYVELFDTTIQRYTDNELTSIL